MRSVSDAHIRNSSFNCPKPKKVTAVERGKVPKIHKAYKNLARVSASIIYLNCVQWPAKVKSLDLTIKVASLHGAPTTQEIAAFDHFMDAFEQMVADIHLTSEKVAAQKGKVQIDFAGRIQHFDQEHLPFLHKHVIVRDTSRKELNGALGVATAFDPASCCYEVRIQSQGAAEEPALFKFKTANLILDPVFDTEETEGAEPKHLTLKDLAALRAAHADTIGGSDTSLGSCLSQSGEVYDDEEVAWQGWLMVSKRELIEPIPTSYKTRYVVVTESKIIQWKGPSATNWATAPTMTKDGLCCFL